MRSIKILSAISLTIIYSQVVLAKTPDGDTGKQWLQSQMQGTLQGIGQQTLKAIEKKYLTTHSFPGLIQSFEKKLLGPSVPGNGHKIRLERTSSDSIQMKQGENVILVDWQNALKRQIRVNGEIFTWDPHRSNDENLSRYQSYFKPGNHSVKHFSDSMLPSAHADDGDRVFWIQVEGMKLYFIVSSLGEKGELLYRLHSQVKDLRARCGGGDDLLAESLDGTMKAFELNTKPVVERFSHAPNETQLTSCKDFQKFSIEFTERDFSGNDYPQKIPTNLCKDMEELASCLQKQWGVPKKARTTGSGKKKKTVSPTSDSPSSKSKDDWQSTQQAE